MSNSQETEPALPKITEPEIQPGRQEPEIGHPSQPEVWPATSPDIQPFAPPEVTPLE